MDKQKLFLPISIVLGCTILGGFFYAIQINKQDSIERQQYEALKREDFERQIEIKQEELKMKQNECESLSSGVMKKWNNVMGVTYDNIVWDECVVTYTDTKTGEVKTSPLSSMKTEY